jgi:hypothetical protein
MGVKGGGPNETTLKRVGIFQTLFHPRLLHSPNAYSEFILYHLWRTRNRSKLFLLSLLKVKATANASRLKKLPK